MFFFIHKLVYFKKPEISHMCRNHEISFQKLHNEKLTLHTPTTISETTENSEKYFSVDCVLSTKICKSLREIQKN